MDDQEPIDLSPLDPSRDRARWDHLVSSVAARARARRRPSVARELVRRGVPAFVLAAAAAAFVWIARPAPKPMPPPASNDPSDVIIGWAYGSADASALVYGGDHASR
ncbi:MAG TPA: hypothetical protein VL463_19875 [Kofleriaceae bacterium]|nr:hypothetical protein [Kofleriaceae bacterium]